MWLDTIQPFKVELTEISTSQESLEFLNIRYLTLFVTTGIILSLATINILCEEIYGNTDR